MPQRTLKILAALAGAMWTVTVAAVVIAVDHAPDNLTAIAVLSGFTAWVPTAYIIVGNIVDRSRALLLMALLDALERTEQEGVRSIKRT